MARKVIIITGASRGIGKALAEDLARDNIVARISRTINEQSSYTFRCDVTNSINVQQVVLKLIDRFKKIDILINCAGVMLFNDIVDAREDEFDISFDVNVRGVFLMCKEILPHMRNSGGGYIINISSIRGITGAPGKGIYSATKFAIRGLTETIQMENRAFNIKATSICPGIIWTESTLQSLEKEGLNEKDVVVVDDIIKTIRYLMSLSSKAFINEIIIGGNRYG